MATLQNNQASSDSPRRRSKSGVKKDNQARQYGGMSAESNFSYDTGSVIIPLAKKDSDDGVRFRIVKLHATIGMRETTVSAVKKGTPPVMPRFEDTDGDRLLSASMAVSTPKLANDQMTYMYAAAAKLIFVQDVFGTGSNGNPQGDSAGTNAWSGYLGRPRNTYTGFPSGEPQIVQAIIDKVIANGGVQNGCIVTGAASNVNQESVPVAANSVQVDLSNPDQKWFNTYYGSQFFSSGVIS